MRRILVLVFGVGISMGTAVAAARAPSTTGDGVYTRAQADAGSQVFAQACAECHVAGWDSLVGFYGKWQGRSLRDLAEYLRLEMPQTDPGSLSAAEYTAVTAYLLRLTRNPPGETPLNDDADALSDIRIDTLKSRR